MGLTGDQRISLSNKGFVNETDSVDVQDDELKVAFKNMRLGVPRITGVTAIVEQVDGTGSVIVTIFIFNNFMQNHTT